MSESFDRIVVDAAPSMVNRADHLQGQDLDAMEPPAHSDLAQLRRDYSLAGLRRADLEPIQ